MLLPEDVSDDGADDTGAPVGVLRMTVPSIVVPLLIGTSEIPALRLIAGGGVGDEGTALLAGAALVLEGAVLVAGVLEAAVCCNRSFPSGVRLTCNCVPAWSGCFVISCIVFPLISSTIRDAPVLLASAETLATRAFWGESLVRT